MNPGDRIRLTEYSFGGMAIGTNDFTVEKFRYCLGIFLSEDHRTAGRFTPFCQLYEAGPESKQGYIQNFGEYTTNEVPAFMNIPK